MEASQQPEAKREPVNVLVVSNPAVGPGKSLGGLHRRISTLSSLVVPTGTSSSGGSGTVSRMALTRYHRRAF